MRLCGNFSARALLTQKNSDQMYILVKILTNIAAVLMIERGKEGITNPSQDEVIGHIDVLIIPGNNGDIGKLLEKIDKPDGNGSK
jgi:uncharacterized protein with PhoU and TrkA domain